MSLRAIHRLVFLAAVAGLLASVSAVTAQVTTKEIEESLTCQCGCGLTVHSCNHLNCGSAIPLKREVRTFVEEGLGRAEILDRFRQKYGEKILAAPVAEGFNLVAWILPFVAVGAGAMVIVVTVRRWTRRPRGETPGDETDDEISSDDRRKLDDELRRGES
jgi:cytochrome c-type biogenesis protein CcmH